LKKPLQFLDAVIVVVTTADAYILSQFSGSQTNNMSHFRMIRWTRVVRTFRIVRILELFHKLRVLLHTIAASFMSLFWSMLILMLFILMSSLFLCQALREFILDEANNRETRVWVNRYYGTSSKATWTMFEVTFSGGWPNYVRTLVEDVSPFYAGFFAVYISAVVFATIRIITAIFLKETLQVAANDTDMMIEERMREKAEYGQKLEELFKEADQSGDGTISRDEFEVLLDNPRVKTYMGILGLDIHETSSLFRLLDDGDGAITYEEFVSGVLRMKGQARSQDVVAILHENRKILVQITEMYRMLFKLSQQLAKKGEIAESTRPSDGLGHGLSSQSFSISSRDMMPEFKGRSLRGLGFNIQACGGTGDIDRQPRCDLTFI